MDYSPGELIEKVEDLIEYCDDTDFKEAIAGTFDMFFLNKNSESNISLN